MRSYQYLYKCNQYNNITKINQFLYHHGPLYKYKITVIELFVSYTMSAGIIVIRRQLLLLSCLYSIYFAISYGGILRFRYLFHSILSANVMITAYYPAHVI